MVELNVRNILANEENRNFFRDRVIAKKDAEIYEPEFKKFFQDNLVEFARIDKMYTYDVWSKLEENEKKKFDDFEKALAESKGQQGQGIIDNKIPAKEFMDKYFPKTKVIRDTFYNKDIISYPRKAKELNLSQEEVNKILAKKSEDSVRLTGDLDLSDWEELEILNLSRNVSLEKIDISKCSKLKEIFLNSSPAYQVIYHNQRMKLDNLTVAEEYKGLKVLMYYGSNFGSAGSLDKLKKNTTTIVWSKDSGNSWEPEWNIEWTETNSSGQKFFSFNVVPKSQLDREIKWMFAEFEEKSSAEEFAKFEGAFRTLMHEVGGSKFKKTAEYEYTDESGDKHTTTYTYDAGDMILASELYRILKKPAPYLQSWDSFHDYMSREFLSVKDGARRQTRIKKYFSNCPEDKVDAFLKQVEESIQATIKEKDPDASSFYLFPNVREKLKRQVRGKEAEEEVVMPKKSIKNEKTGQLENKTVPFKELIPFSEFKIGKK